MIPCLKPNAYPSFKCSSLPQGQPKIWGRFISSGRKEQHLTPLSIALTPNITACDKHPKEKLLNRTIQQNHPFGMKNDEPLTKEKFLDLVTTYLPIWTSHWFSQWFDHQDLVNLILEHPSLDSHIRQVVAPLALEELKKNDDPFSFPTKKVDILLALPEFKNQVIEYLISVVNNYGSCERRVRSAVVLARFDEHKHHLHVVENKLWSDLMEGIALFQVGATRICVHDTTLVDLLLDIIESVLGDEKIYQKMETLSAWVEAADTESGRHRRECNINRRIIYHENQCGYLSSSLGVMSINTKEDASAIQKLKQRLESM